MGPADLIAQFDLRLPCLASLLHVQGKIKDRLLAPIRETEA